MLHLLILLAFLGLARASSISTGWTWTYPVTAAQCESVAVTIQGGAPPFELAFIPISPGVQPILWNLNSTNHAANANHSFSIPVRLRAGTPYTVVLADQNGYNGGPGTINPLELMIVAASTSGDSSCLQSPAAQPQQFTFAISGGATECGRDFQVSWSDYVGTSAYSFTVIPLDLSYNPFDVDLTGGPQTVNENSWTLNMTAGTRFTVVMNNYQGYGYGGIGGIYQVAPGSTACLGPQSAASTGTWPAAVQTSPIAAVASLTTTIGFTASSTSASSTSSSTPSNVTSTTSASPSASSSAASSSGLGGGAIGGIAAGAAVAIIGIITALVFFCLRKRRRDRARPQAYRTNVDLGDQPQEVEPKVSPYSPNLQQADTGYNLDSHYAQPTAPFQQPQAVQAASHLSLVSDAPPPSQGTRKSVAAPTWSSPRQSVPESSTMSPPMSPMLNASPPGSSSGDNAYISMYSSPMPASGHDSDMTSPQAEYEIVQHQDAGEAPRRIELPPGYNQVPARQA